jgi:NhaP-type Na+/H+ or K+/H+ antiporter
VGYSIKKTQFFENMPIIGFLGVVSTVLTVCLFAVSLIALDSALSLALSSKDALLLSIVLASADPVAALPLLKESHARLAAVASGEGVLNSAVVIVLFGTVASFDDSSQEYR